MPQFYAQNFNMNNSNSHVRQSVQGQQLQGHPGHFVPVLFVPSPGSFQGHSIPSASTIDGHSNNAMAAQFQHQMLRPIMFPSSGPTPMITVPDVLSAPADTAPARFRGVQYAKAPIEHVPNSRPRQKRTLDQSNKQNSAENKDHTEDLKKYAKERQARRDELLKREKDLYYDELKKVFIRLRNHYKKENDKIVERIAASDFSTLDETPDAPSEELAPGQKRSASEIERIRKSVWSDICKNYIPRIYEERQVNDPCKYLLAKRLGIVVSKRRVINIKTTREFTQKAKKLSREMLLFWKKYEKEEREMRKRAEKEALERQRLEEEEREKRRQARKLNFLITQTELYGHFIGKKTKKDEPASSSEAPNVNVKEIDFADVDDKDLDAIARKQAQQALDLQIQHTKAFDKDTGKKPEQAFASNFEVQQPKMLTCQLKKYQLKGLNWLANLYDQGINGILADDMGLGKTVQSISLLAWLAETQNIWGPFLVVAPASTLHNWQQEVVKFAPNLRAVPYWGNIKDRKTLRKFWSGKRIYNKDSPFHVVITSYQIVVTDQSYFQRVKWQYMVLDEAHAIKSAATTRWKVLLNFNCRNRLLLTGTPIQNSMQELWALLHFIMPTLFDSHEEFSEWFSKDIESHAVEKGKLNQHQLERLHMILKPFMLRRVKKDVEHELGDKIEKTVYCELTPRQRRMYKALSERVSIDELLDKASLEGRDIDEGDSLMNVVMQFRKVCNHPQIFEQAEVASAFYFFNPTYPTGGIQRGDQSLIKVACVPPNPLEIHIPKLVVEQLLLGETGCRLDLTGECAIFRSSVAFYSKCFDYLRLTDYSFAEFYDLSRHRFDVFERCLRFMSKKLDSSNSKRNMLNISRIEPQVFVDTDYMTKLRNLPTFYYETSIAGPPNLSASHTAYYSHVTYPSKRELCVLELLYGQYRGQVSKSTSPLIQELYSRKIHHGDISPLIPEPLQKGRGFSQIQVPNAKQLLFESGKLQELDKLLGELKQEGHRVLLYFQMTKMIDLMEEYLSFRQYSYLRLDGSSKIEDRRDMVADWQSKPEIFIFLLSTRAGGLGLNLTAADTVIFYDSDWVSLVSFSV
jgi:DNA helicase INO80